MTYQPFLIATSRVGKETDLDPYVLPDDAYPELLNAYLYRGVIRKKGGTELLGNDPLYGGRLGIRNPILLAARGAGNSVIAVNLAGAPLEPGSIIVTDGTTVFTDNGVGGFTITGGTGTVNVPTNYVTGAINITFTSANLGATITATYLVKVGANSPVMGLCTREIKQINNNALIAFDMTHAYQFDNALQRFVDISTYKVATGQTTINNVVWTGTNSQFFDYQNFQNAFFATNDVPGSQFYKITNITQAAAAVVTTSAANNFAAGDFVYFNNVGGMVEINNRSGIVTVPGNPFTVAINSTGFSAYTSGGIVWSQTLSRTSGGDGIRWYDGTGWVNFDPPLDATTTPNILQGALLLFAYKGRLVALNTFEGQQGATPTNFAQRARYSQQGSVFYAPPFPAGGVTSSNGNEWYTAPGLGGFEDAPTAEVIVAAEFIKDVLVVYFERSTYRLVSTTNSARPFFWEKINTEIGAESTFSTVPFDKEILSIGPNGVYECDSINIERIDQKIPDQVFNFGEANQGITRIHGIRDFYTQFCYWTYVDEGENSDGDFTTTPTFPNKILAYNYLDESWANFQNYFTCFGYYQTSQNLTWATCNRTWDAMTVPWDSARNQTQFPLVVAGNQQGFVVSLSLVISSDDDPQDNAPSLVIQNITNANPSIFTVPNHNLDFNTYVLITGTGLSIDNQIYLVFPQSADTFYLVDSNGTIVSIAGYTFGGRVQTVENFFIQTKKFTPYIQSGQKVRVGYIDLFLETDADDDGVPEDTVPAFGVSLLENENFGATVFTKIVALDDERGDPNVNKFWKRVYLNQTAQSFSLKFSYTNPIDNPDDPNQQIFEVPNIDTQVAIHGMIFWMAPAGRLVR